MEDDYFFLINGVGNTLFENSPYECDDMYDDSYLDLIDDIELDDTIDMEEDV